MLCCVICPITFVFFQLQYHHINNDRFSGQTSCVEYLCDLLCFHLDLAHYVAIVNSGQSWDSKNLLCLSHKEQVIDDSDAALYDPFVENLILNSLAVQTPMRVSTSITLRSYDMTFELLETLFIYYGTDGFFAL